MLKGSKRIALNSGCEVRVPSHQALDLASEHSQSLSPKSWCESESVGDGSKPIVTRWVKTYCYHIWRNNHPLTSYFRAPRVPRVLTHNQLRLKINILDLSGNCLTGAGETLAEALGVVASARLGVSSREWFDNFFAPQDPVSLSSQSG
jgi:hypothetical protein